LPYYEKKFCKNYPRCKFSSAHKYQFENVFDLDEPMYLVFKNFDLKNHAMKMKKAHPNWTERQCKNLLYWQRTIDNIVHKRAKRFIKIKNLNRYMTVGEGFGLNIYATCRNAGLKLEHIRRGLNTVRKLALLAKPKSCIKKRTYVKHLKT